VLFVLRAVEHYCTIVDVGLFVLPLIEGSLIVVVAGEPPLLLCVWCCVVSCTMEEGFEPSPVHYYNRTV